MRPGRIPNIVTLNHDCASERVREVGREGGEGYTFSERADHNLIVDVFCVLYPGMMVSYATALTISPPRHIN